MRSILSFIQRHAITSFIALIVLLGGGWWAYAKMTGGASPATYTVGTPSVGTVISSVTASGQVSSSQELVLKSNVSGQVTYVGVTPGQKVLAGALIAQIDSSDAQKAVRDAQANLDSANLSLQKLQKPATQLSLTQSQNSLDAAKQSLEGEYHESLADILATWRDLPDIMTNLQSILLGGSAGGSSVWNIDYYKDQTSGYSIQATDYRDIAYKDYITAREAYDKAFNEFKSVPSTPTQSQVEVSLIETQKTAALVTTAIKSANNLIQFYSDQLTRAGVSPKAIAATHITSLNNYQSTAQSHLATLQAHSSAITSARNTIKEREESLVNTRAGTDVLDVQSSQLSVTKAQNSLRDAQENLADYSIRAPFAATVASLAVHRYDQASGDIATLVSPRQLAELSLNEVDASKVSVGQKATLAFDALEGVTLTGSVAEIDTVGTVTQGVVTYVVKVAFDVQDDRVKSGMSVNASIQAAIKQDVLTVPASSIKTQSGQSYVEVFSPALDTTLGSTNLSTQQTPTQVMVQVGISDDTMVEIVSGLTGDEQIVTRTTSSSTSGQATPAATTGGGGFGGGTRIRL